MAVARKLQHSRLKGASAHQPGWSWKDIEDPQSSGLPNWSIQSVDRERKKPGDVGTGKSKAHGEKKKGGGVKWRRRTPETSGAHVWAVSPVGSPLPSAKIFNNQALSPLSFRDQLLFVPPPPLQTPRFFGSYKPCQ